MWYDLEGGLDKVPHKRGRIGDLEVSGGFVVQQIELLELHSDAERRRMVFAAPEGHFAFDPGLRSYATLTPAAAQAIFQSDQWLAPDYAGYYQALSNRLGRGFSKSIDVMTNIPLVQEGARHKQLRREMAELIASALPEIQTALPGELDRLLTPLDRRRAFRFRFRVGYAAGRLVECKARRHNAPR